MTHTVEVLLRCIAAIVGGYALSALFSVALVPVFVHGLESSLSSSVLIATMLSYMVFFVVIIMSFCRISLKGLYLGIMTSSILLWSVYKALPAL